MDLKEMADAIADAIQMVTAPLHERIKQLEARPTFEDQFRGLWNAEKTYRKGETIVWDGSSWICVAAITRGENPAKQAGGDARPWRIIAMRGKDGRDLR